MQVQPLTYTVPDAIRASGIKRTKLYELIGDGRLKVTKVGRRTLVTAASLRALVLGEAA